MFLARLKRIFGSPKQPPVDAGLSLAMPENMLDSIAAPDLDGNSVISPQSTLQPPAPDLSAQMDDDRVRIPFLGRGSVAQLQKRLLVVLALALMAVAFLMFQALHTASSAAQQLGLVSQTLTKSQRMVAEAASLAAGQRAALADSAQAFEISVQQLLAQAQRQDPASAQEWELTRKLAKNLSDKAALLVGQQQVLTQLGDTLRVLGPQSASLFDAAQAVWTQKAGAGASAAELSVAHQMVLLTQRMGRMAQALANPDSPQPDAAEQLSRDMAELGAFAQALQDGHADLRLPGTRDAATRERLGELLTQLDKMRARVAPTLGQLPVVAQVRQIQKAMAQDSETLRRDLESLQADMVAPDSMGIFGLLALVFSSLVALLATAGLFQVQVLDGRKRHDVTELQRLEAQRSQDEARRLNDANQAAILRLMNELQAVAEGDLTQQATVSEDITGAIADSVNYTVEELRNLVTSVQATADKVAQTTAEVDFTSTELLVASKEQLHEIQETGQAVVDMAQRITQVSTQADQSSAVAQQSRRAADTGLQAVQNTIGSMNTLRDQIQETSKRIKRLGESSQEIGDITELISDITEQTNVLALNAAIQAASAGEAGRGFSVVAEEVQRLAERSADATRQIAALVRAIQSDTQDAIAAMERSTLGVVEGARLSDNAGTALSEIDQVSRRLHTLIDDISRSASREAELASNVAINIQHIFAVTEQTGEGTQSTAAQVRELSHMAQELRHSVARFKIA